MSCRPPDPPLIEIPSGKQPSVSTDAKAVELVNDVTIIGRPSRAAENTDSDRRQMMMPNPWVPAFIQSFLVFFQASAFDQEILIEIEEQRVIIGFINGRFHPYQFSNELTCANIEARQIFIGIAG